MGWPIYNPLRGIASTVSRTVSDAVTIAITGSGGSSPPVDGDSLLMESGDNLLLESGDKILLED